MIGALAWLELLLVLAVVVDLLLLLLLVRGTSRRRGELDLDWSDPRHRVVRDSGYRTRPLGPAPTQPPARG